MGAILKGHHYKIRKCLNMKRAKKIFNISKLK